MRDYLKKLKEVVGERLIDTLWHPVHGDMDAKYWIAFGKKPFLGQKYKGL